MSEEIMRSSEDCQKGLRLRYLRNADHMDVPIVAVEFSEEAQEDEEIAVIRPALLVGVYDVGDVFFNTVEIPNAVRQAGDKSILFSITFVDQDDQKDEIDLIFFSENVGLGVVGAVPTISDASALYHIGDITLESFKWQDLGGVSVATLTQADCGILMQALSNRTGFYVAALTQTASTHTAQGLQVSFDFLRG